MTPTPKLRFVERTVPLTNTTGKIVHVLQQWWEGSSMGTINLVWTGEMPIGEVKGEWRDVPLETEQ